MRAPPPSFGALDDAERARLAAGEHDALAAELAAAGRHALAGWVREQIWDFGGAMEDYRAAQRWVDALRVALESGEAPALDRALAAIEDAPDDDLQAAIALLRKRRRNMEVARLLASRRSDPEAQAQALLRAGNNLGAARVLAEAARPRDALLALELHTHEPSPQALALAARLSWDLGDAEGAARRAQQALQGGERSPTLAALLARALGSLGHDLAAQLVLQRHGAQPTSDAVPGRYRVTGISSAGLAGAAYVGVDRLTLQEVEIHLLLADQPEPIDPRVSAAIDRFMATAVAASQIGHPAIRPVLRVEPDAGLLVMARAEGPPLRAMIRPPGLRDAVPRARALVAFLLEGLAAAHDRGLVHGGIWPSQIVTDALGRPQLGPFGSHHLAGLAATRTGGLEELVVLTAPELRRGGLPTAASDLYAVGILLRALLTGRLTDDDPSALDPAVVRALDPTSPLPTDPDEAAPSLLDRMTAPDPAARPSIAEVLDRLRAPVADLRALGPVAEASASRSRTDGMIDRPQLGGVEVTVASSWSPALLDALCEAANPWLQPILDRHDRTLVLAPWPERARGLDETVEGWRGLVPPEALDLPDALRLAIEQRLRPTSVVVTAAGPRMLALDDLLSR